MESEEGARGSRFNLLLKLWEVRHGNLPSSPPDCCEKQTGFFFEKQEGSFAGLSGIVGVCFCILTFTVMSNKGMVRNHFFPLPFKELFEIKHVISHHEMCSD